MQVYVAKVCHGRPTVNLNLFCKDFIEAVTGNYCNKDAPGIYDAYMLLTPGIECYSVNSIYL